MKLVAETENENGDIEEETIFDFTASVSWGNDDIMLIASESYEDDFTDTPPDFVFADGLIHGWKSDGSARSCLRSQEPP